MANLADIFMEGRKRRNWSQLDLAVRAGVSVSTISRTEQGRGQPNVNTLRRLAQTLGVDPDVLIRAARDPDSSQTIRWTDESAPDRPARTIPGVTTADRLSRGDAPAADESFPPPAIVRVPHYGSVSAVRTDLRDLVPGEQSEVPDVGVDFTVTVDGQCMEPRYEDAERVGCSLRRWEAEGFIWGKDYWIRFKDGETTLKRVTQDMRNHEKFICTPLNPAAKPFSRYKADVAAAARVLVVLTE